jgi:transposase
MARAYSQDLRDRVIDAAFSGTSARRAADRFGIGLATAIRWVRQARETGDRTPGRQGQPRRSKLDPHRDYILRLVETTLDMTISEMLEKLAAERGVQASRATLWTFLDRCGLTFKKVRTRGRAEPSGHPEAARGLVRRPARSRSRPPRVYRRDMGLHQHGPPSWPCPTG